MTSREEICPSSGEPIPDRGSVRCVCGRHWGDHDAKGEPRFTVPIHGPQGGIVAPEKLIVRTQRGLDVWLRRRLERAEMQREGRMG